MDTRQGNFTCPWQRELTKSRPPLEKKTKKKTFFFKISIFRQQFEVEDDYKIEKNFEIGKISKLKKFRNLKKNSKFKKKFEI